MSLAYNAISFLTTSFTGLYFDGNSRAVFHVYLEGINERLVLMPEQSAT
jgi:hypothetical protein